MPSDFVVTDVAVDSWSSIADRVFHAGQGYRCTLSYEIEGASPADELLIRSRLWSLIGPRSPTRILSTAFYFHVTSQPEFLWLAAQLQELALVHSGEFGYTVALHRDNGIRRDHVHAAVPDVQIA